MNVHSHAFQRGLRGLGEIFPSGLGDFWSWRREMYRLVESMDGEKLHQLSLQAFCEMLAAGFTSVGEFHYLRHESQERGFEFDQIVLRAAEQAGIRIVLLCAYYRQGGFGQPASGAQERFLCDSPDQYWRQFDRLAHSLGSQQTLGAAVHSVRAALLDHIRPLHAEAKRRGLPFHMHVEEQTKEIEDCRQSLGAGPMRVLLDSLEVGQEFTAVHCTHTIADDLQRFSSQGGSICICPLTEANLGDGIPNLEPHPSKLMRYCIGTDSNLRVSGFEEMRWLEYAQRLVRRRRGAILDREGSASRPLMRAAAENGGRALGLAAGSLQPGYWADFLLIDLSHRSLRGWSAESLLDSCVFGCCEDIIDSVWVGGRCRFRREAGAGPS